MCTSTLKPHRNQQQKKRLIIMNSWHKGKLNLAEKKPRRVIRKVEDLPDISGEIGREIRGGGGEEVAAIGLLVITKSF